MKKVYVTKKEKKEKGRNKYLTTREAFNYAFSSIFRIGSNFLFILPNIQKI